MNRTAHTLRNGVGLLLALAAGAAWLIVHSRPRPPQTAGSPLPTPTAVRSPTPPRSPSPTARPPGPPASPTPAATRVGQRVPFCTFPGGEPPEQGGPGLVGWGQSPRSDCCRHAHSSHCRQSLPIVG